ncbi:MAG: FadR/GntR family transcriptional regulator [Lachnospiraceae bacterium]
MKSIDRISIVDQVIQNLLNYMKEENLKPGDQMPTEREVCELLGVGRSTAREAYRMLQAMNEVVAVQGKGVFVSEKENKEDSVLLWFKGNGHAFCDYMEVRMAIEPMGVRFAIERANDEQIHRLEKIQELFIEAYKEGNRVKMMSYDESFHDQIMECTGNTLLIRIGENISECLRGYRSKAFSLKRTRGNAIEPHQKIIDAFKQKDVQMGYEWMLKHLEISMEDISKCMELEEKGEIEA